ncbi:calcium/sodium antiporter [Roseibacillus ishigakijimensis]|uniref:Calcium/sodium antiporter n=1 Tax=Roseibacillus ishigakijimensis TaxID=454146 RepID=A0A934RKX5_9BACT|nr:calcium/sodium antiporter [Roseibacillus ishigakijimensis]MBK1832630.1 calcium/sodium antiporter [Roseibacillus ishigakijimensis]
MEILSNSVWVVFGLVLLYYGAEWLVKGSSELALRVGISPLVVGLTVVAFGTSAPELLVSVSANMKTPPEGDIALGNVVGSNICNLALVLGIAALIRPFSIHRQVLKREMPILLVATGLFVVMLMDGRISRLEGGALALGVVLYTVSSIRRGKKGEEIDIELDLSEEEIRKLRKAGPAQMIKDVALIILGLVALVAGADRLVFGGSNIATVLGVPTAVIALTLVAFGTSLPEIATVVVASLKGEGDLITGNAVGSCIFNLLAVIGITAAVAPLSAQSLQFADLIVMSTVTVLLLPFMWTRGALSRLEGTVLVGGYLVYVVWLFLRQG